LSDTFTLVAEDSADHWWLAGHARQPNMQYNEWLLSTHATSLADMQASDHAEDSCLACHSQDARQTDRLNALVEEGEREGEPLEAVTVSDAQWGVTCTTCHNQHSDAEQPFNLVDEAYALCTGCHTNPEDFATVHHPVREMFEGVALVEGVEAVPSAHFAAEEGPRCVTCHMQPVPVDVGTRGGHSFQPILPGASDELPSACAGCHDDLTTTDLMLLVGGTQDAVAERLAAAQAQLDALPEPEAESETAARYAQIAAALHFVENDGSLGIHNYDYANALLIAAEHDLSALSNAEGAGEATATVEPTPLPSPAPTSAVETADSAPAGAVVESGIRPVTLVVIAAVVVILLVSAFAFFRKPAA
jgi:predicted CXXCH cytochrome family protein